MDSSNSKVGCPIFIGIIIIIQGIIISIPFSAHFGDIVNLATIIGSIMICVGSVLIIFGIVNSIEADKQFDEFARVASESSRSEERIENTISSSRTELSPLTCPKCGAPIKSDPPCRCEYCGVLIR